MYKNADEGVGRSYSFEENMPSFSRRKQYAIHQEKSNGGLPVALHSASLSPVAGGGVSATLPLSRSGIRSSQGKSMKRRFGTMKGRSSTKRKRTRTARPEHRQPLITTDSMVLHELIPSLPMPNEMELNVLFAQIVVS